MVDETTPADAIPIDHLAYAALHRETQALIKKLQEDLADHVMDEAAAFHSLSGITTRLDKGQARMDSIEKSIADNHAGGLIERKHIEDMLRENTDVTQEIKNILDAAKGFFKVGGWIATGVKWLVGVVTGCIALYLTLKGLSK